MLRVLPDEDKVVVEGINRVYKHLKPNRRNPQGGRLSKEMPIDVSNVLLFCADLPPRRRASASALRARTATRNAFCKKCGSTPGPV